MAAPYLTRVLLCTLMPVDATNNDIVYIQNWAAYVESKRVFEAQECSFQRDEMYIRYPAYIEEIEHCSYLAFLNPHRQPQWKFGFITRMEYANDGMTRIYFTLDYFHTYQSNIRMNECFIERRHSSTDEPGDNLVEEGLALGDYTIDGVVGKSFRNFTIIVASTKELPAATQDVGGGMVGHLFSGIKLYAYTDGNYLGQLITMLRESGKISCIQSMWAVPNEMVTISGSQVTGNGTGASFTGVKPTALDTYIPRNKKLLTYPFVGIELTNLLGNSVQLKYEDFTGNPAFTILGNPVADGCMMCYPVGYQGQNYGVTDGVRSPSWLQCNWTAGGYSEWLATQNIKYKADDTNKLLNYAVQIPAAIAGGGGAAALGAGVAGAGALGLLPLAASAGIDLVKTIVGRSSEREIASLMSPSVRGMVGADTSFIERDMYGFFAYAKSIKREFAAIIDDFFDMYGYAYKRVEKPEFLYRPEWSYIKCVGAICSGQMPQEAQVAIASYFNRGVRFWANPEHFGDYSFNNGV